MFAVDGLDGSAPAGEGFFEVDFDRVFDVVAFAGEKRMWFLCLVSVSSFKNVHLTTYL